MKDKINKLIEKMTEEIDTIISSGNLSSLEVKDLCMSLAILKDKIEQYGE